MNMEDDEKKQEGTDRAPNKKQTKSKKTKKLPKLPRKSDNNFHIPAIKSKFVNVNEKKTKEAYEATRTNFELKMDNLMDKESHAYPSNLAKKTTQKFKYKYILYYIKLN